MSGQPEKKSSRSFKKTISHERLLELVDYCPDTGVFRRKVALSNRNKVGEECGNIRPDGYREARIDGTTYLLHRLAWFYMTGEWPENLIDHKNRNRSDNSFDNLRPATDKQNHENKDTQSNNTSGVTGVYWETYTNKWRANIKHNGRSIYVGRYACKESAIAARMVAERRYYTHAVAA